MSNPTVSPEALATFKSLQEAARAAGSDVNAAAGRFAVERLLHRVFASPHAGRFAVKGGALMLLAEGLGPLRARSTSDADLAIPGFVGTMADFETLMRGILGTTHADGVVFDLDTFRVRAEREGGSISGGAVTVLCLVGRHKVGVKVDVTFDERTRADQLESVLYPVIMGEGFRISRVPNAHAAADKIQAMIRHGARTHRLRDHYDLFVLMTRARTDPAAVAEQLPASLACFELALPGSVDEMAALSDEEAVRRERAWDAERRTRRFGVETPPFRELNAELRRIVGPVIEAANSVEPAPRT